MEEMIVNLAEVLAELFQMIEVAMVDLIEMFQMKEIFTNGQPDDVDVDGEEVHESALSKEEIDAEILRAIAKHPHQLLVSTKEDGYYCSFDWDEVYDLTHLNRSVIAMIPTGEIVLTPEAFHDCLVRFLSRDFDPLREVSVLLYSHGARVREGLFICYSAKSCFLGGVRVRSMLELDDP
jgi:hypothetical protein